MKFRLSFLSTWHARLISATQISKLTKAKFVGPFSLRLVTALSKKGLMLVFLVNLDQTSVWARFFSSGRSNVTRSVWTVDQKSLTHPPKGRLRWSWPRCRCHPCSPPCRPCPPLPQSWIRRAPASFDRSQIRIGSLKVRDRSCHL